MQHAHDNLHEARSIAMANTFPLFREGDLSPTFRRMKQRKCALFLGSGPSAMMLQGWNQWQRDFDIWSSNYAFLHPYLVSNFHYFEVKGNPRQPASDRRLRPWLTHFWRNTTKYHAYQRTAFFGKKNEGCPTLAESLRLKLFFSYNTKEMIDLLRECTVLSRAWQGFNMKGWQRKQSILLILHLMYHMKYTHTFVIGVDMNSKEHFWNLKTSRLTFDNLTEARFRQHHKLTRNQYEGQHNNYRLGVHHAIRHHVEQCNVSVINLSSKSVLRHFIPTYNHIPNDILRECDAT